MRFFTRTVTSQRQAKKEEPSSSPRDDPETFNIRTRYDDLRDLGRPLDAAAASSTLQDTATAGARAARSGGARSSSLRRLSTSGSVTRDSCEDSRGHLPRRKKHDTLSDSVKGCVAIEGHKAATESGQRALSLSTWCNRETVAPRLFSQRYTLGAVLGEGASSHVLMVYDTVQTGTAQRRHPYACKVIRFREDGGSEAADEGVTSTRADVEAEVRIMRRLRQKNLLALHDCFVEKTTCYIVMDLMEGGDLMAALRERGSLPEDDCREVVTQILKALVFMHQRGIAHRDVKLENVMLEYPGSFTKVALGDFGMAMEMTAGPQLVGGTPLFVAPELLTGVTASADGTQCYASYDTQVDMWSMGVILYMLLSGYPPFQRGSMPALFACIKRGAYSFNDPCWELVSDGPKDLVNRLLTLDPARRISASAALSHPWILEEW